MNQKQDEETKNKKKGKSFKVEDASKYKKFEIDYISAEVLDQLIESFNCTKLNELYCRLEGKICMHRENKMVLDCVLELEIKVEEKDLF